jgi:hypothetical protein
VTNKYRCFRLQVLFIQGTCVTLDKTLIDMKNKTPSSGKSISRSILLYATLFVLFFSTACKKNMETQVDLNTSLNTKATVTSAGLTETKIEDQGMSYYTGSSGGTLESHFVYSGDYNSGYVTISGSALGATQYHTVYLSQGSNTIWWNVGVAKTGSISATISIGNASFSLGTVYVYAISSGGVSVTPMPGTVHLSSYYQTGGILHLIFNWPTTPNSVYDGKMVFAALKSGPEVRLNTILQPYEFQEYSAYVSDGTLHMTWPINPYTDGHYLQVAFTTDYLNLKTYFDQQHNFTVNNTPSDPFLVTGLQSGPINLHNSSNDINVLKIINGVIQVY